MSHPVYACLNGKLLKEEAVRISPNNRSFRYGDGFFETMKLLNERLVLEKLHLERLFSSLEALQFERPSWLTPAYLQDQVLQLAQKNRHQQAARIRLTVFRGDGGLYNPQNHLPNILVQSWPLPNGHHQLNENGLVIKVYADARKTADAFSHIKSNNYLSYAMAAGWVKQQKLNDALLLNAFGRIADATIANVFVLHRGVLKTPALTEGCIAGVMRRYLLQACRTAGIPVEETVLDTSILAEATEVLLSNAISGIRWVRQAGDTHYGSNTASLLFKQFIVPLSARG